jgi:glutathione reductase (NADPH)
MISSSSAPAPRHPSRPTNAVRRDGASLSKKILVRAAESVDHARRMRGKGVAGAPTIAWSELIEFKRTFTGPVPRDREKGFAEGGIDAFHGRAKFQSDRSVAIDNEVIEGRFILLGVGAVPMRLGITGEEFLITNTEFLELEHLPKRVVLLGGGYIAAEFAHIAARAGADVTILEQMERMLTPFDPDLVAWLMEKFREIGVDLKLNTRVTGIAKDGNSFVVRAQSNGQEQTIAADIVVHAAGRAPDLEPLDQTAASSSTSTSRAKPIPRSMRPGTQRVKDRRSPRSRPETGASLPPTCFAATI